MAETAIEATNGDPISPKNCYMRGYYRKLDNWWWSLYNTFMRNDSFNIRNGNRRIHISMTRRCCVRRSC